MRVLLARALVYACSLEGPKDKPVEFVDIHQEIRERETFEQRLKKLDKRVQYIEDRLKIVRQQDTHGDP